MTNKESKYWQNVACRLMHISNAPHHLIHPKTQKPQRHKRANFERVTSLLYRVDRNLPLENPNVASLSFSQARNGTSYKIEFHQNRHASKMLHGVDLLILFVLPPFSASDSISGFPSIREVQQCGATRSADRHTATVQ